MSAFGTITATAAQLRAGSLSPVALIEATLDRIARLELETAQLHLSRRRPLGVRQSRRSKACTWRNPR